MIPAPPPVRMRESVREGEIEVSGRARPTPLEVLALNDPGELYRLLVESVRDHAIFALDPGGHILSWNPGAERFKGYSASEIVGRHFSIFYPPDRVAAGFPQFELEMATREGRFEDEGWRVRKDGSRFWANVVITALRGDNGALVGFAKVTRDLTERRESEGRALRDAQRLAVEEAARRGAEERSRQLTGLAEQLHIQAAELEARRREAEEANRAKSQFLAAMSHELRTPLNAIGGYAELLELEIAGPLTDQQRVQVDRIRRSQQHLLGIITDILNFSRLDAGQLTYDMGPVSLEEVVQSVVEMVMPQALATRIRLEVTAGQLGVVARADRARVEQILLNLLSNALKFTKAGGEVTVSIGDDARRPAVCVRDTGIGIPTEKLDTIFQPFVQIGRSLTSHREGTGLGLAISRDLARAMGGELSVDSRSGEGSVFTLRLPPAG
jgi:PAS domain S-box-containing protein